MNRKLIGLASLAALAGLLSLSQTAKANSLTIINQGFESPIVADGGYTSGSIPGWITAGVAGVFNPPASQFPGEAPEGQNVSFSQGPVISQSLSDVLTANTVYTLEVEVGSPSTQSFPGYSVQLRAGGSVLAEDNNALSPLLGTFATSVVTFTADTINPHLGQFLEIVISSRGAETDFDNVRLTAIPVATVPEPATAWFFGLGLCSLLGYRFASRRLP